jgi:hypothetical protein
MSIKVTDLEQVGSDERGYTYEYFHERYGRHLIVFRRAGSISGRHYHKGISMNKNPEIIMLCHGCIRLNWRKPNNPNTETLIIEGPKKIEIPAFTWHELIAETDCCFIELNSVSEHESDTFREE